MSQKTKADLERELKKAKRLLKCIVDCFEQGEAKAAGIFNKLDLGLAGELDIALDEAREFLK